MFRYITQSFSLAAFIIIAGCGSIANASVPVPIIDDNGHAAFVRQVVPKLLGRKPKGTLEINLLKDIANLHGREAVVRLLMELSEFNSHWAAILIDHMKVQRPDLLTGNRTQSAECFEEAQAEDVSDVAIQPVTPGALAEFVRDQSVYTHYHRVFNMFDLIKSSLQLDNLFPAYRGYLFVLTSHPNNISNMRSAAEARAEVGAAFDDIYLNRNLQCMTCHRSTYSTTGIGERTHPLHPFLDLAVFDYTGLGEQISKIVNKKYSDHCQNCHGDNGTNGTATYPAPQNGTVQVRDASAITIKNEIDKSGGAMSGLQGIFSDVQIDDIANALKNPNAFGQNIIGETALKHYAAFRRDIFSDASGTFANSPEGPWNIKSNCAPGILGTVSAAAKDNNDEDITAFFAGVESQTLTVVDVDDVFHTGYQNLGAGNPSGTSAAYMLAAKITDNVWEQLMGERLTIVNQFARNGWQKSMHQHLTENAFIANDWSLKELIVEILGTRFFNRQAPVSSIASGPYVLHPLFDPFIPADQTCIYTRDDHSVDTRDQNRQLQHGGYATNEYCALNGQGELVHRYSPRNLLNSISHAMAWPKPKIFPGNKYPDEVFSAAIGQYTSDFDIGDKTVGFQTLLNWDNQYGACNPADYSELNGNISNGDWLDHLIENIDGFNEKNPDSPLTLGELVLTLKDWLIQEPVFGGYTPFSTGLNIVKSEADFFIIDPDSKQSDPSLAEKDIDFSEEQLVYGLFGTSLNEPVSSDTVNVNKLRELCGVYLKAPQFMLAGLSRNDVFEAPRYRVCNDDTCSYYAMCREFKITLGELEYPIACGSYPVSIPDVKPPPQKMLTTGDGKDANTICVNC